MKQFTFILVVKAVQQSLQMARSQKEIFQMEEAQTDPKINRDKIVEIMFETFNIPSLYFENQPVLSLYLSRRTSVIILDAGDCFTHAVPIFDGYPISNTASSFNMSGKDLALY